MTKSLLDINYEKVKIRNFKYFENLSVNFKIGEEVVNLNEKEKKIFLKSGEVIKYDKVLIATGCDAKKIEIKNDQINTEIENLNKINKEQISNEIEGIFSIKNLENIINLQKFVGKNEIKNVVVIGSSFIAIEAAGCLKLSDRDFNIILVNKKERLLEDDFGSEIGDYITKFIQENGVIIKNNVEVKKFITKNDKDNSIKKIKEIILNNEEKIKADLIIYGIGAEPSTNFISSQIKEEDKTIKVDKYFCSLKNKDIFAVGDISKFPSKFGYQNIRHYSEAFSQGEFAAFNMLGKKIEYKNIPFFWSRFFNKSFCYIGYQNKNQNKRKNNKNFKKDVIIKGDLKTGDFLSFYFNKDECYGVGCSGKNSDLVLIDIAMRIGIPIYKEDVQKQNFFEILRKEIDKKNELCKCMRDKYIN